MNPADRRHDEHHRVSVNIAPWIPVTPISMSHIHLQ
jgi:hypothetical protein